MCRPEKYIRELILIETNFYPNSWKFRNGKTTLAKELQSYFGYEQCLLLQQDVLRRSILHADDHKGTPAIDIIETLVKFGFRHYPIVILEGILRKDVYGSMLRRLCKETKRKSLVYYVDIPFELSLKFNRLKIQPFTIQQLRKWWISKDYLTSDDTKLSSEKIEDLFERMVKDINN